MYQISDAILEQGFKGLQVKKIVSNDHSEILIISLKNGSRFPEHTSPRDAFLIMLEGEVEFHINNKVYLLKKHQTFNFPATIAHWVSANKNSKFLIVR